MASSGHGRRTRNSRSLRRRRRHAQRVHCRSAEDRLFDEHIRQENAIENGDNNNPSDTIEMPGVTAATTTTLTTLPHQNDDLQIRLNGDTMATTSTYRTKSVDNEDDGSYSETRFNDDLLCFHGNLCAEENNRKLVPEQVWRLLKKYFPYANEFTSLSQPCGLCKSIASEAEVAKDMYKTGAVSQKESLGDLYSDRNRPQLVYRHTTDADTDAEVENEFYLINKEFINSWRKFIRENGKKEPPYSIRNKSWLLCADHSGLLYDLNQRIPNTIVVITRTEWQLLCKVYGYNADREISVKCMPDGTVVSNPDVCIPCMRRRIEIEEKAQLCYSKAKIYIKVQTDEEAEYLSNEDTRPAKRAKLSAYNGSGNGITNGNGCLPRMNGGSGSTSDSIPAAGKCATDSEATSTECRGVADNASTVEKDNHAANVCASGDDGRQRTIAGNHSSNSSSAETTRTSSSCRNEAFSSIVDTAAGAPVTAVRRSSRCRRVRGVKEIIVSSDLTLLDVKKKICEMMSVAPMDQHLFTSDGRSLTENAATLTELSVYPESVLHLKVDEPCEGVIADEFIIDREPEAGFKGTGLVGS